MSKRLSLRTMFFINEKRALIQEDQLDLNSLDAQIDKYLTDYENESQKGTQAAEALTPTLKEFYARLYEAKEDVDDIINKITGDETETDDEVDMPSKDDVDDSDEKLPLELVGIGDKPDGAPAPEEPKDMPPPEDTALSGGAALGSSGAPGDEQSDEQDDEELQPEDAEPEAPVIEKRPGQLNVSNFAIQIDNLITNANNLLDIKGVIIQRAIDIVEKNYGDKDAEELRQALKTNYDLSNDPEDNE